MAPIAVVGIPRIVSCVDPDIRHLSNAPPQDPTPDQQPQPNAASATHDSSPGPDIISGVALSPCGAYFAAITGRSVLLWTTRSCVVVAKSYLSPDCIAEHGQSQSVSWRHDSGQLCVTSCHGAVLLFDLFVAPQVSVLQLDVNSWHSAQAEPGESRVIPSVTIVLRKVVRLDAVAVSCCAYLHDDTLILATHGREAIPPSLVIFNPHRFPCGSVPLHAISAIHPILGQDAAAVQIVPLLGTRAILMLLSTGAVVAVPLLDPIISNDKPTQADDSTSASTSPVSSLLDLSETSQTLESSSSILLQPTVASTPAFGLSLLVMTGPYHDMASHYMTGMVALGRLDAGVDLLSIQHAIKLARHDSDADPTKRSVVTPALRSVKQPMGDLSCMAWNRDGDALFIGSRRQGFVIASSSGQVLLDATRCDGPKLAAPSDGPSTFGCVSRGVLTAVFDHSGFQLLVFPRSSESPVIFIFSLVHSPRRHVLSGNQPYQILLGSQACLSLQVSTQFRSTQLVHFSSHWYPPQYITNNWPVSTVAIDHETGRIALAARHGFVLLSHPTGKWHQFHNSQQEQQFTCLGMLFVGRYLLAVASFADGVREMLMFDTTMRLDINRTVLRYELTGIPRFVGGHSGQMFVVHDDNELFSYHLDSDTGALLEFHHGRLPLWSGVVHQIIPCDSDTQLIVHIDDTVVFVDFGVDPAVPTSVPILGHVDSILAVGVLADDGHADLWCTSGGMCVVFLGTHELFRFPLDVVPLAVDRKTGVLVGLTQYLNESPGFGVVECVPEAKTQLIIPQCLEFGLKSNDWDFLESVANRYSSLDYFDHALELLLMSVWTSATGADLLVLGRCVEFLQGFPNYLDIVVNCIRKSEMAHWDDLFAVAGDPLDLFELCMSSGRLHTATAFLVVLHSSSSLNVSTRASLRVLECALESDDVELCRELVRFMRSIGGKGASIKLWSSGIEAPEAGHARLSSSDSMEGLSLDLVLHRHVRQLLKKAQLSSLVALIDALGLSLGEWLCKERQFLHPTDDLFTVINALHAQFGVPFPDEVLRWQQGSAPAQPPSALPRRTLNTTGRTLPDLLRRHSAHGTVQQHNASTHDLLGDSPYAGPSPSVPARQGNITCSSSAARARRAMSIHGSSAFSAFAVDPTLNGNTTDSCEEAFAALWRLYILFRGSGVVAWCMVVACVLGQPKDLASLILNRFPPTAPLVDASELRDQWHVLRSVLVAHEGYKEFVAQVEKELSHHLHVEEA